jgi:hypothetical protein
MQIITKAADPIQVGRSTTYRNLTGAALTANENIIHLSAFHMGK